jgi:hypothetical protein
MRSSMKNSDRYVSIALIGLSGFWTYQTFQIRANALPGAPGPRFFPFLVIGLLFLFSLQLLVSTFKKDKKLVKAKVPAHLAAADTAATSTPKTGSVGATDAVCDDYTEPEPIPKRIIYSFIAIFLYVVASGIVGFYVATVPFVFTVIKWIMKTKSWIHSIIGTLVITGVIYLIFTVFFKLSLPRGSLW